MTTTDSPTIVAAPDALVASAKRIIERELAVYERRTAGSHRAHARASEVLPLGVPSSFQAYPPYPIVVRRSQEAWMEDVDGNRYIDFDMGFGALFAGHCHPSVRRAMERQLDLGTLYVTPCEANAEVAELLRERYGLPLWRFTNSGTEATMDALRVAKGVTGRDKIVKVEGGYHGHHDEVMVSMKPTLDVAGPADAPHSIPATAGLSAAVLGDTIVVPYNDAGALERVLDNGDVAAFIVEPVMQNIGICLPQPGYLQAVREITRRHGTMLVFDEVKTGITAGWGGATSVFGVQPDLVTLAKSIGGGLSLGAFGGTLECMDQIASGRVLHLGTYNGNPLCMAAARAVLADVCTPSATGEAIARCERFARGCDELIHQYRLPAHTIQFGAKGCVTWAEQPIKNYRDYKATNFDLAYAQWIHHINRGLLLPPGLDDQWLVSVLHTDADIDHAVAVFEDFARDVTGVAVAA